MTLTDAQWYELYRQANSYLTPRELYLRPSQAKIDDYERQYKEYHENGSAICQSFKIIRHNNQNMTYGYLVQETRDRYILVIISYNDKHYIPLTQEEARIAHDRRTL